LPHHHPPFPYPTLFRSAKRSTLRRSRPFPSNSPASGVRGDGAASPPTPSRLRVFARKSSRERKRHLVGDPCEPLRPNFLPRRLRDRKSTRLNSSHLGIS